MSSAAEINHTAQVWRIRFDTELLKRGATAQARREMIDETPDWLRSILGMELRYGLQPVHCVCAKWYTDGTHTDECEEHMQKKELEIAKRRLEL